MTLSMRPYKTLEDYWNIREFLRRLMLLNKRRELSWHVARLDYWWWFANPDLEKMAPEENVFIWETADGKIGAVLNPEGQGQAFLQLDPEFRNPELVDQMLGAAQEHLAKVGEDAKRHLQVFVDSQDKLYRQALMRAGFKRLEMAGEKELQHRRDLKGKLPEREAVPGYTVRALGDGLELLERCYASGLGFHDDDIAIARDNRDHPAWYHHIQSAPLYRRDLDIVAVAADGSIASFCTAWFDDVSRTAYFEPVATVPAHQRHGLARAVMIEALHRLKDMGCKVAFVGGYSARANALYFSVMGPESDISEPWEKSF